MAVLSLSKLLVLAVALGQVLGAAVDRTVVNRDLVPLDSDGIEVESVDTTPALLPRANLGDSMVYVEIAPSPPQYGGGFWYQEIVPGTAATADDEVVRAAAKNGWLNAVAKAAAASKPKPAIGCALFIPSKGWIIDTSLKDVNGKQSHQTCQIVTGDMKHKNLGNCAEMNALAIMLKSQWPIPDTGAKMACYGDYGYVPPKNTESYKPKPRALWVKPCSDDPERGPGCKEAIEGNPQWKKINVLPKRIDKLAPKI